MNDFKAMENTSEIDEEPAEKKLKGPADIALNTPQAAIRGVQRAPKKQWLSALAIARSGLVRARF